MSSLMGTHTSSTKTLPCFTASGREREYCAKAQWIEVSLVLYNVKDLNPNQPSCPGSSVRVLWVSIPPRAVFFHLSHPGCSCLCFAFTSLLTHTDKLLSIIRGHPTDVFMVFCNTVASCDWTSHFLMTNGIPATKFHAGFRASVLHYIYT